MFGLEKLFKRKTDRFVYKLGNLLDNPDKTLVCYSDLYKKLGLFSKLEELKVSNNESKYHYKNVRANEKTITKIGLALKDNLINTKNKWSRIYKKTKLGSMAAWDSLMFAPFSDEKIKDDTIVILAPTDKDYTKFSEE